MDLVDFRISAGVATITMDRPPVNALNADLIADIGEALERGASPEVRAVVITGSPHFAAGADITGFQAAFDGDADPALVSSLSAVATRLKSLAKPTIAAIKGFALGGGLELAMGADLRYLSEGARVGQPEILLGIIPGAGGTQRLPRLVGYQRALELCMSGRHVHSDEAARIGIADKVVPEDALLEVALADAAEFAAGPTIAYSAVKRAIVDGYGMPLDRGLEVEAAEFARAFGTNDARAGVAAFLAKENPQFGGS